MRSEGPKKRAFRLPQSPRTARRGLSGGFPIAIPNVAVVGQDDLSGGKQLARHLLKRHMRSVVFVRPALDWSAVEQREKGLRSILAAAAPAIDIKTLIAPSELFDDVHQVVKNHLAKRTPDAIVARDRFDGSRGTEGLRTSRTSGTEGCSYCGVQWI